MPIFSISASGGTGWQLIEVLGLSTAGRVLSAPAIDIIGIAPS
jgi:hypothetical protein